MRPSRTPCVLLLALALAPACSDDRRRVLESAPAGCAASGTCVEAGAVEASAPKHELGACFGENIDCESDPVVSMDVPGPMLSCQSVDLGHGAVAFRTPISGVACPNPPCTLSYGLIHAGADGMLDVTAQVDIQSGDTAGAWVGRLSRDGNFAAEAIAEFAVPSRLALPRFYFPVGFDAAGDAFLVETVGRAGGPRENSLYRYDYPSGTKRTLATVSNVSSVHVTVGPDGGFVVQTAWLPAGVDAAVVENAPQQLDVSRYDASGRLLFNQTKLSRALELTAVDPLGFDAAGNLYLMLTRETGSFVQTQDNQNLSLQVNRVAKVDRDGNVRWVVELPQMFYAVFALAPDGGLYVWRRPLENTDGDHYATGAPVIEHFDASGRSTWLVPAPASRSNPSLAVTQDGDLLFASAPSDGDAPGSLTFHEYLAQGNMCFEFDAPVDLCSVGSDTSKGCEVTPDLEPGPNDSIYFATHSPPPLTQSSSSPAILGRVTRP